MTYNTLTILAMSAIAFLLGGCQESSQVKTIPWPKLQSELLEKSQDEIALVKHLQSHCLKTIGGQENPIHYDCVNWLTAQIASAKDSEGNLIWGKGRGLLVSQWLLSLDPEFIVGRQIKARELFITGQVEEARGILVELKDLEHASGFEVYWLAQLERQAGQYELASAYAEEFEEYGLEGPQVNVSLQEQIEAEAADHTIEEEWDNTNTANFRIFTVGEMDQAEWVGEVLEEKWSELLQMIGKNYQDPLEVVIYDDKEYGGQAAKNQWVAASYNGKLRIPRAGIKDSQGFQELMIHELTHALLDRGIGKDVPMWFHEGLAQYMEGKRISQMQAIIEQVFQDKTVPSISDIQESFIHEHDGQMVKKRYLIALSMVETMIGQGGLEDFQNLVSLSLQNNSFVESWPMIYTGEQWKVSALYKTALSSLF